MTSTAEGNVRETKPNPAVQFGERIVSAFAIAALSVIVAAEGAGSYATPWLRALDVGLFAAILALFSAAIVYALHRKFADPYVDLAWRAVTMGLQTLVGLMATAGIQGAFGFDWSYAWHVAVIAVATSLLKALIGVNNPNTFGATPIGAIGRHRVG